MKQMKYFAALVFFNLYSMNNNLEELNPNAITKIDAQEYKNYYENI